MSISFPLGLLYNYSDLMEKCPAPVRTLLDSPWCGGLNITVNLTHDNAAILAGINVFMLEGDTGHWEWNWERMTNPLIAKAYLAMSNSHWLSAYVLQTLWNDTHLDVDGPTHVCVTILPSGIVMGLDDPGTVLEYELNELEGSFVSDDPEELAYQAGPEGFPTAKLASIIVDKNRVASGHAILELISDLQTITEEWKRTQRDDTSGLSFLSKIPFTAPIPELHS